MRDDIANVIRMGSTPILCSTFSASPMDGLVPSKHRVGGSTPLEATNDSRPMDGIRFPKSITVGSTPARETNMRQ